VVVEPGEDLGAGAVGEWVVGEVGLPGFVWQGGLEADVGRAGPFLRAGVIMPRAVRYRLMVAVDTVMWWWCSRCQAMVSGPASSPCSASCLRRRMIRSTVSGLIAFGDVFGRLDRGSNAASPLARYRTMSLDTIPSIPHRPGRPPPENDPR
jgi:hypothetical protein